MKREPRINVTCVNTRQGAWLCRDDQGREAWVKTSKIKGSGVAANVFSVPASAMN